MSHFIANSLTISKDFKQFKVKGGDNNCFPRSNYWSEWIKIDNLLDMLNSGNLQFGNSHKEKFLMLNELTSEFAKKWSGNWNDETDMYHSFRKESLPKELDKLNKEFIERLKSEYKGITKKEHYVHIRYGYVSTVSWSRDKRSHVWYGGSYSAKKFGKYQAKEIARKWSGEVTTVLEEN